MAKAQQPYYEIGGRRYHRITAVLQAVRRPGLEDWRGRLGNKEANLILRNTEKIGTEVHQCIQDILVGKEVKPKKLEVKNCLTAFQDWRALYSPSPLFIEKRVHSMKYGFAGTIDLVEDEVLTDWKTSSRLNPTYWMQLAAYITALEECVLDIPKIQKVRLVRLDKSLGIFDVAEKTREEVLVYLPAFLGLLQFYVIWNQEIKKEEEANDYGDRGDEDGASDKAERAIEKVARPEVPNDRGWENRQE